MNHRNISENLRCEIHYFGTPGACIVDLFIYKTTEGEVQTVQEAVLNKDLAHKYYGSASIKGQTTERQQY